MIVLMKKEKIVVVGLGYVGFPLLCLIDSVRKYDVFGYDLSKKRAEAVSRRENVLDEEFLNDFLANAEYQVSDDENVIEGADFVIICVPTPVLDDKTPDLSPIEGASRTVLKYLRKGMKIIVESTVNPGVCEEFVLPILEESGLKGGKDFELSHCPERINPGDDKWNVQNIPRNVGSLTIEGNKVVANFYRSFLEAEVNEVDSLSVAEATKVIENTFRDINIAYVNELAKSFDLMGIDLKAVIKAASNKPFAFMPHYPSCGVGGHCIPVDPYYLIQKAQSLGFNHTFLRKARAINNSMPEYTVELLVDRLNDIEKSVKGAKISLLGMAYKANVGDLRESPSLEIYDLLVSKGADIKRFDPYLPDFSDFTDLEEALGHADVLLLATNHREFDVLTTDQLKKHQIKIVIDGKNCLNKVDILDAGIIYKGIGH
jgi:UDP-N-acetyl-D-glucosamine dehydrogenase